MTYQLSTAKIWDGSQWVVAAGGGAQAWPERVDSVRNISVTSSATAHTKGAWTELIASTVAAGDMILVYIVNNTAGTATEGLLDIGIGASGAETVIVANAVGGQLAASGTQPTFRNDQIFPVAIPAGSRVAARLQNVASARTAVVGLAVLSTGYNSPTALDTIGATTATSRGTNLPTSNTYVQLTASTSQAYRAIVMVPLGATSNTAAATSVYTLAKGAAGSEVALGTLTVATNASEFTTIVGDEVPFVLWESIPAGTRLAVKQSVGAVTRDVILYGVP